MNILVVGGSGFISSKVVEFLVLDGHSVSVLNRGRTGQKGRFWSDVKPIKAERNDIERVKKLVHGKSFDAVMDFVAYDAEDARSAVKCFSGLTGHYLHCSTISVYMVSREPVCPITEDQDHFPVMDFWLENPFGMQYGIDKRACEEVFWESYREAGFPYTALRPTYVSGPGDPAARDFFWAKRILDGGPVLVPEGGKYKFHLVYVEDVAQAFVNASKFPETIGNKYNIASEEVYTLSEYLNILARTLGVAPELIPLPAEEVNSLLPKTLEYGFPFHTYRDAYFSIEAAKQDLNFQTTPLKGWLSDTIEWFSSKNGNGSEWRQGEIKYIQSLKGKS